MSAQKESISGLHHRPASDVRSDASQTGERVIPGRRATGQNVGTCRRRAVTDDDGGGRWLPGGIVFRRRVDDVDVVLAAFGAGVGRRLDH